MTLVPIMPQPGVWKNGTRYQAKGRYYGSNLIRWHDNALRPVGGWQPYTDQNDLDLASLVVDPAVEAIRDAISWRTVAGTAVIGWGSNLKLITQLLSGVTQDITPAGLAAGNKVATLNEGYGEGYYSFGAYGAPPRYSASNQIADPAGRWSLDTWGETLLAMPDWDGKLYQHIVGGGVATQVANAPVDINDFVVTNQRIVMTVGCGVEPRSVKWCDQEDLTNWDFSDPTNQAGRFTLSGNGNLIAAVRMQNSVLIFSETDVHLAQYVGPPYIYTFRRIAENCSPLHRKGIIATENFVAWVGERNFWVFDGAAVKPLPCDVIDFVAADIDPEQVSTAFSWSNSDYTELWWHYATNDVDNPEPAAYVSFDWEEGHWAVGRLDRTVGLKTGVVRNPLMVDYDGFLYSHELPGVGFPDGYEAFAETGPLEQASGDSNIAIRRIIMDTTQFGVVNVSFTSRQHPTGPERSYGPYTYANPIPVKVSGREIQMRINSTLNGWEVGEVRADMIAFGKTAR